MRGWHPGGPPARDSQSTPRTVIQREIVLILGPSSRRIQLNPGRYIESPGPIQVPKTRPEGESTIGNIQLLAGGRDRAFERHHAVAAPDGLGIRELLAWRGQSQEALADAVGLGSKYIAGIEGGVRNITLLKLYAVARALRVSARELLPEE